MPTTIIKKYKRNYRKRYGRKRRRNYRKKTMQNIRPFPMKKLVNLKYTTEFSIDAVAGNYGSYLFRANSCADPDASSATVRLPRAYDEWMAFYSHCTVIGSKIKLTAMNTSTTNTAIVGVQLNNDDTETVTDVTDLIEQPFTSWKLLGNSNSSTSKTVYTRSFSAKKFLGISHPLASSVARGLVATNPSEEAYFIVFAGSHSETEPPAIRFIAEISYIAVLTEPRDLARST